MRIAKKSLVAGLCVGVLLVASAPAFGQTYPPPRPPTCNVSDRTVEPGQVVRFGGRRWKPNSSVVAGFHQKSTDTALTQTVQTDSEGTWFTSFTIPNTVENGPAVFGAKGRDKAGRGFRCIIQVTVVNADSPASTTAATPAGITVGMLSIALLSLFGVSIAVLHRRRSKRLLA